MVLDRILTLIANLLSLAGVRWWGWDAFEVLVLYWMQTVLVVVFTVLHVRKLPRAGLGEIEIGGKKRPATHRDYLILFSIIGLVFCAAHIGFLWVFFSADWSKVVTGPTTFWQYFVIANGAWVALLLNLVGGLARYVLTPPRAAVIQAVAPLKSNEPSGKIDDLQLGLFIRIFAMQAAIIFGAMLARSYGANHAPLVILIVLKTLFDFGASFPARTPAVTAERK
jgi:hypothetical protein